MPALNPGPLSPDIGLGLRECTLCPSFLADLNCNPLI